MIKLSKAQQEILDKMRNGWELGHDSGLRCEFWLQQGGLGKGGKSIHGINSRTIYRLLDLGIIEWGKYGFPTRVLKLKAPPATEEKP